VIVLKAFIALFQGTLTERVAQRGFVAFDEWRVELKLCLKFFVILGQAFV